MLTASVALERLRLAKNDVDLARLIRSGCGGERLTDFKVAELRLWKNQSYRKVLYRTFEIPKRSGGSRHILAPSYRLKTVQRIIAKILDEAHHPTAACHAFLTRRGIATNAKRHVGQSVVLRIDLSDFFHSIHFGRVRGLLLKGPFGLDPALAELVALLCTYPIKWGETVLPQGAPTSPVLANLISKGLDRDLTELARTNRCQYTRYADDLTFSSRRNTFPFGWVKTLPDGVVVGPVIENIINRHDFEVNHEKTRVRGKESSQRVTGLVVNRKVNVPREYVRNLRAAIHCVKREGLSVATARFMEQFDSKFRPEGISEPEFLRVLRGRFSHVVHVRGWNDVVTLRLGQQLSEVDPDFAFNPLDRLDLLPPLTIYVEGKTDWPHIQEASRWFRARSEFLNVQVQAVGEGGGEGAQVLSKQLKRKARSPAAEPQVYVFDSDEAKIVLEMSDSGRPRKWNENIYSVVLPTPSHREGGVCIELLYNDTDLLQTFDKGRRLYLRTEFDDAGVHESGELRITQKVPRTLVIDNNVVSIASGDNVALSKAQFVRDVVAKSQATGEVSYRGFQQLFETFQRLAAIECNTRTEIAAWLRSCEPT